MRHLENMVQYQYNWGLFFNKLKITLIDLYDIGYEFIYVYLVKILQNKSILEKNSFAIEITIVNCV